MSNNRGFNLSWPTVDRLPSHAFDIRVALKSLLAVDLRSNNIYFEPEDDIGRLENTEILLVTSNIFAVSFHNQLKNRTRGFR